METFIVASDQALARAAIEHFADNNHKWPGGAVGTCPMK